VRRDAVAMLIDEADQLTRILVASRKTAQRNKMDRRRIDCQLRPTRRPDRP
jgi:hypothetical protein